jgi:phosphocarrier protein FPr
VGRGGGGRAVLRIIGRSGRAAAAAGVDVAVCGEAAADDDAVPVLLGLGVGELSVAPLAVPRVKAAVRRLDRTRCAALAASCLDAASPAEVRRMVAAWREPTGAAAATRDPERAAAS